MSAEKDPVSVVLVLRQQLSAGRDTEGYLVQVTSAPVGSWGGPFLPGGLDDGQIKNIRQIYKETLEYEQTEGLPQDPRLSHALRVAGEQLFRTFPETVQDCLHAAQAIAKGRGCGLHLVLTFERSAWSLLGLPWELLSDPEMNSFFALRGAGLSREISLRSAPKAPFAPPKRMLGLWAEPNGLMDLSVRQRYAPHPAHEGSFTWLCGPGSLRQIEQALQQGDFDGLHIVAHGRGRKHWGAFRFALEAEDGSIDWVNPDQVAALVAGYPQLRLVYLDVCAGANQGEPDETSAQEETAPTDEAALALLRTGIQVVVGMQDNVSQAAAGLCAQTFYQELAQGKEPAQAMTAARRAVRLQLDDPIHWSIPVLYTQARPREPFSPGSRLADWVLDHVGYLLQPRHGLALIGVLFAALLSGRFAAWSMHQALDWRALGAGVMLSHLLTVLGAGLMRSGQVRLAENFSLDRSGWLKVFTEKYFAAAIWSGLWWLLVWLVWLGVVWSGAAAFWGTAGRQLWWFLALLGLSAAGYVGARQAIRQANLFLRVGSRRFDASDLILFVFGPFFPLLIFAFGVALMIWLT